MDTNKVIQSLWIGSELSNVEKLCIKSFLANGHDFHLYTYKNLKGIPEGTCIMDANEILPENKIFTYQKDGWGKGSYAGFANLFRYHLLYLKGSWWVDMDTICLKYFDISQEVVISTSYEYKWGEPANNCMLKFPKGHHLVKWLRDESDKIDPSDLEFAQTGPFLVQRLVKERGLKDVLVPYYYFNPITRASLRSKVIYKNITLKDRLKEVIRPIFKPETMKGRKVEKGSYAVHLWNEAWRNEGFNKNDVFSPTCLFEKLKKTYFHD